MHSFQGFIMRRFIVFLLVFLTPAITFAQLRFTGNLAAGRFEQQVKTEVGGARGERLVEDTFLGVHLAGTYSLIEQLSVGLYARGDVGFRSAGEFEAFDEDGAPTIMNETGGGFTELWLGPLVSGHYKTFFVEIGYGLLGVRTDSARDDLPGTNGKEDAALQTSPTIAWMVAAGGGLPITKTLQANLRLEYRVRYYTRRGGEPLADNVAHGTQNFTPFFGVVWTP